MVIGIAIAWYLKNAMSDTLEATGRMASREIIQAESDQIIRHHNQDAKRTEKYNNITDQNKTILTARDILNLNLEGKI